MDWVFSTRSFNDVEQNVTEVDQFNTESVVETEALVREATQNSQDARLKTGSAPVRVRIGLVDKDSGLDGALLDKVISGLKEHLAVSGFEIPAEVLKNPSALVVEDFGTEGLTGKIDDELDPGNFRSFWFRHGSSFKHGTKNGRWGLGKLVFPMMSEARCFFGLTIPHDNPRPLLLGQAVLKSHQIGKQRYAPHGHFGDAASDQHICPVTDHATIANFRSGFCLQRKDEPGLSVVIPYPRAGTNKSTLLQFVVRNYAYPILTGRLAVEVLGELVTAETIRTVGKDLLQAGLIEFIDSVHDANHSALIRIKPRLLGSTERLTEQMVDADLTKLREDYAQGALVGFHVPVALARKKGGAQHSFVEVFLRRRFETEDSYALYVRGDITVPDEAARFRGAGVFAALLAKDDFISEFLADAENPAHTKWQYNADRVSRNWKYTQQTLTLIRDALPALHRMLATGKDQEDPRALTNFFWIDDPDAPKEKGTGAQPTPVPTPGPIPPLPPAMRKVILTKKKGGFSIKPGPAFAEVQLPTVLKVEVFYDVEVGKAKWDSLDFDLTKAPVRLEVEGADEEIADNTITLTIDRPEFSLTVEGFDEKRDLLVVYNVVKLREAVDA